MPPIIAGVAEELEDEPDDGEVLLGTGPPVTSGFAKTKLACD